MARGMLIGALCALLLGAPAQASHEFDTLNALLEDLVVNVPSMTIADLGVFGSVVLESNGTLNGASLQNLTIAPAGRNDTSLGVTIYMEDLVATLSGGYKITTPLGTEAGPADFNVNATYANITLWFNDMTATHPATSLAVGDCNLTASGALDCHGWGNTPCTLVNASITSDLIQTQICGILTGAIGPLAEPLLQELSDKLEPLVKPLPEPESPTVAEATFASKLKDLANMNNTGFVETGKVLKEYLGEKGPISGDLVINGLTLIVPPITALPGPLSLSNTSALRANLSNVVLSGFNSFSQLDLLQVEANHTLRSQLALEKLTITADADVALSIPDGLIDGGLDLSLKAALNLELKVAADLQTTIGLNVTEYGDFLVGSLLALDVMDILKCIIAPVDVLDITSARTGLDIVKLGISVTDLSVPNSGIAGAPSSGITKVAQELGAALVSEYEPYIDVALPYVLDTQLLPLAMLGLQLSGALDEDVCPGTPGYEPKPKEGPSFAASVAAREDLSEFQKNVLVGMSQVTVDKKKTPAPEETPAPPTPSPFEGVIDFNSWVPLTLVDTLLTLSVSMVDMDAGINRLINIIMPHAFNQWNGTALNFQGSKCVDSTPFFFEGYPGPVNMGDIHACVGNLTVTRLDKLAAFQVLTPQSYKGDPFNTDYVLGNTILTKGEGDDITIAFDVDLDWNGRGDHIQDRARMTLSLASVNLGLNLRALIVHDDLFATPLRNVTDPSCLLGVLAENGLKLATPTLTMGSVKADVQCYSCSSDTLDRWGENLRENPKVLTETLNNITKWFTGPLDKEPVNQLLEDERAGAECGEELPAIPYPDYEVNPGDSGIVLRGFIVGGLAGGCLFIFIVATVLGIRNALNEADGEKQPLNSSNPTAAANERTHDNHSDAGAATTWEKLRMDESMWGHESISTTLRLVFLLGMLVVIVCLILTFFVFDEMNVLNTYTVAGQERTSVWYPYTILGFGKDGWNSGETTLQVMAFGVLIASGAWSLIKVQILLWAFFVPPTVMSHATRTTLLFVQDFLAKWSLLDIFINLLLIVYQDSTTSPQEEIITVWADGLFAFELHIELKWGFVLFGFSQVLMQLLGQALLFNNRNMVANIKKTIREREELAANLAGRSQGYYTRSRSHSVKDAQDQCVSPSSFASAQSYATVTWFQEGAADETTEALRDHLYGGWMRRLTIFSQRVDNKVRLNLLARGLIFFSIVASIVLFIWGFSSKFIHIREGGLIGQMAYLTTDPDAHLKRDYNLGGMLSYLYERSKDDPHRVLNVLVVALLMICCIILPILLMAILLLMWFMPMTLRTQKQLYFLSELCASWSAPEMLVVAMALLTPATKALAIFVQGNRTNDFADILRETNRLGWTNLEHPMLEWNEASYQYGFWLIFVAAVLYNLVYVVIHQANRAAIRYREKKAYDAWYLRRKLDEVADVQRTPQSENLAADDEVVNLATSAKEPEAEKADFDEY